MLNLSVSGHHLAIQKFNNQYTCDCSSIILDLLEIDTHTNLIINMKKLADIGYFR